MEERRASVERAEPVREGPRTPAGAPDEHEENLYDAYLTAALGGEAPEPAEFLAGRAGATESLRARLDALREATNRGRALRAAPSALKSRADALVAEPGLPFERLGEFRLLRHQGDGGMGAIYLAVQESLGRIVALKVLRPELRGSPIADARFEREALAVARLDHPHIVQVLAVGEDRGVRFLAMAYVEGRGLDEILAGAIAARRAVPTSEVLRWGAQIARALACAHAASIVHRDVKPSNVRITPDGRAMLLDFGIARALDAPALTMTGPFVGTPLYAAPEQLAGDRDALDARADTYALGVTLYECLSGRPPFGGSTAEQVLHEVLAGDAPPLRRLAPSLSRDAEIVVAKAMSRQPSQRYATANDLADDLEALLAFRPIRARPPGPASRLVNWARRNPGLAAMAATGAVALFAGAMLMVSQARAAEVQRKSDARRAVVEANGRLADWRRARESSAALEADVRKLLESIWSEYLTDDRLARLDRQEVAAASLRREREAAYYEVLDMLARAERLDPAVPGAAQARTNLYLERWREAEAARDREAASFFRELVLSRDQDGAASKEIRGACSIRLVTGVPGAEAWVFRYRELRELAEGGEPRAVPVPVQDAPPAVAPGTLMLVVTSGAGELRRGDLVLDLDGEAIARLAPRDAVRRAQVGGVAAGVHRDGVVERLTLPPGLRVRATAAPLVLSPACRRVASPSVEVTGEPGEYLILVRAPGREELRVFHAVPPGAHLGVPIELLPEGTTPEGFVRIERLGPEHSFWIQEREVTAAEYAEFLNDDATRAEVAASAAPIRFPRDASTANEGGYWPRGADGRWSVPPDSDAETPVLGVSQDDARAYATWFARRTGAAERGLEIRLPTQVERVDAAGSTTLRKLPFGEGFRPRWASSCYARPKPGPVAVLSHPVDESPYGVFDMAGSAREWSDDRDRGLGRLCGGSWAVAKSDGFQCWFSLLVLPDRGNSESGFRLVAVAAGKGR